MKPPPHDAPAARRFFLAALLALACAAQAQFDLLDGETDDLSDILSAMGDPLASASLDPLAREEEEPPEIYWPAANALAERSAPPAAPFPGERTEEVHAVPLLWPQRGRTVFAAAESPVFHLLVPRDTPAGDATLFFDGREIGRLPLPAVAGRAWDSRAFTLDLADFPPGLHTLSFQLEHPTPAAGDVLPLSIEIVRLPPVDPFLLQTMSCCTGLWPSDDEGLARLRAAGLGMLAATGHNSQIPADLPRYPRDSAATPAEAGIVRPAGDLLLERALRHGLRIVDLTVARGKNFYNEGLAFHHSAPVSMERMLRRLSIFATHSADFPSFFGVNYGWFPKLGGYVEGGIPTDDHVRLRNEALADRIARDGIVAPTPGEIAWYEAWKRDPGGTRDATRADDADDGAPPRDPAADRARALDILRRRVDTWRAAQARGFGDTHERVNEAVRRVRPDLACLLFDNAGHDGDNRARSQFHDLDAVCYESYTDYGEWPFSASFSTDWARGTSPGQPVWLTSDWGTTDEGQAKSLFHALFRGLQGGGCPMQEDLPAASFAARARVLRALRQLGPVARFTRPDGRIALLADPSSRACNGRSYYDLHALYVPLTRLGFPPVVLDGEDVAEHGVPAGIEALFIVRQLDPLLPEVEAALDAFSARGGRLYATGDSAFRPASAVEVGGTVSNIWTMAGFQPQAHRDLWADFPRVRGPLGERLAADGFVPRAATDPERAFAVTMDAPGGVRYVLVASDVQDTVYGETRPVEKLEVDLEGTWASVRDLSRQQDVAAERAGGRTRIVLDLVDEPLAVLALCPAPPAQVDLARDGEGFGSRFAAAVRDARGRDLGPVPLSVELLDGAGNAIEHRFLAAGDVFDAVRPRLAADGDWTLRVQELLAGHRATLALPEPGGADAVRRLYAPVPVVHVPDPRSLREFFRADGEKVVLVEPNQTGLLPLAEELAAALRDAGVEARVWQPDARDFAPLPLRWRPREAELALLEDVAGGRRIAMRVDKTPFIDPRIQAHVPEKGGYGEIDPPWRIGRHVILFSGGVLADSLRAATPWMPTANTPGSGHGRLLACFHPFDGGYHAAVVAANDATGLAAAARELGAFAATAAAARETAAPPAPSRPPSTPAAVSRDTAPVETPLAGLKVYRRVKDLVPLANGGAAVWLDGRNDTVVVLDAAGEAVASFRLDAHRLTADRTGRLWAIRGAGKGLYGPAGLVALDENGTPLFRLPAETGDTAGGRIPPVHSPFPYLQIADSGDRMVFGRAGAIVVGDLPPDGAAADARWTWIDDLPFIRSRCEAWAPRTPLGVSLSPGGRFALFSMANMPTGCTSMSGDDFDPAANETLLLDTATGERVWAFRLPAASEAELGRGACSRRSSKAGMAYSDFSAVSRDGSLSAFADYLGNLFLVDGAGAIVLRHAANPVAVRDRPGYTTGAPGGVGVWMDPDGTLALFGFEDRVWLATRDGALHDAPVARLSDGCVAADGTAVAAQDDGLLLAFDASGAERWRTESGGLGPVVRAARDGRLLVATHSGETLALDPANGEILWRTDAAAIADAALHPVALPDGLPAFAPAPLYRDPGTLETAKRLLDATLKAEWTAPAGAIAHDRFGRLFHRVEGPVELALPDTGAEAFAHLVYRLPENGAPLSVEVSAGGAVERFSLDLPTPEFRILDLPVRAGAATVTLSADAPFELAGYSLWTFDWPGDNLAYVEAGGMAGGGLGLEEDDLLGELDDELFADEDASAGAMKECRIYTWNPDPDKVKGPYLNAGASAMQIVDGRRFGEGGGVAPWSTASDILGPWFTVDFKPKAALRLVATYERELVQSRVSRQLVVFSGFDPEDRDSGTPLASAIENDQFWRLFPIAEDAAPVLRLGVHVRGGAVHGLSEIEAYR
ncbi:MAG: PQQ-binding-like beta-propeller repeat protein [Kiritimatiellia bacterium]